MVRRLSDRTMSWECAEALSANERRFASDIVEHNEGGVTQMVDGTGVALYEDEMVPTNFVPSCLAKRISTEVARRER